METEDISAIALAIAKANKHTAPDAYAARVVAAFEGQPMPDDSVAEVEEPQVP